MWISLWITVFGLLGLPTQAWARDQFGDFQRFATASNLKPFARDLGGILGSATFHSGRSLGFSGFDMGMHGGIQLKPDQDDEILNKAGVGVFGIPWVQGEIGLPFRFDGFIRGISFQGITIAGGGLRYGVLKVSDKPYAPQVLVSMVAGSVVHQGFSVSHFGGDLVMSLSVPVLVPYLGLGLDRTRLVVKDAENVPRGTRILTSESRFTTGFTLKFLQFGYLQGAYTLAHGDSGFDIGLGIRF